MTTRRKMTAAIIALVTLAATGATAYEAADDALVYEVRTVIGDEVKDITVAWIAGEVLAIDEEGFLTSISDENALSDDMAGISDYSVTITDHMGRTFTA